MLPLALEIALALLIFGLLYLAFCTDLIDAALIGTDISTLICVSLVTFLALIAIRITYPDLHQVIINWLQSLAPIDLDVPAPAPAPAPDVQQYKEGTRSHTRGRKKRVRKA